MGTYAGDQLFHAIYRDNHPTTISFMYLHHHKVEATQVLNVIPCIIYEELLANPNNFITRSGIQGDTIGIWYKDKRTLTNPN